MNAAQDNTLIPRIISCNIFRAYLHCSPPSDLDADSDAGSDADWPPKLPPSYVFEECYRMYTQHSLTMEPMPLYDFAAGVDPVPLFNGHVATWRIFEGVVLQVVESGENLNENHSDIDWREISGHPVGAGDLTVHFMQQNYRHIAPIVKLWLSDRSIEVARDALAVQLLATIPMTYRHEALALVIRPSLSILALIHQVLCTFSEQLPGHLRLTVADLPRLPNEDSDKRMIEYISSLATSDKLRRVVRLFPSALAQPVMNILQWVLNRDRAPSQLRTMTLKLLQDTASELGRDKYPAYMFHTVGKNLLYGGVVKQGGEAMIHTGELNGKAVAIRVPSNTTERVSLDMRPRRYKKGIASYFQINHDNVVKMIGLYVFVSIDGSSKVSVVMPWMKSSLSDYIHFKRVDNWVREARMVNELAAGVTHLHRLSLAHGDLHWHNVMIDAVGVVKICDFGISRIEHSNGNSTSLPPYSSIFKGFSPPEIVPATGPLPPPSRPSFTVDIYSCGMLIICLAMGVEKRSLKVTMASTFSAFDGFHDRGTTSARVPKPNRWTCLPLGPADALWRLVQDMTAFNPQDRARTSMDVVQERLSEIFKGTLEL